MDLTPAQRALIALQLAPGIGPRTVRALLDHFASPWDAISASVDELSQIPYLKREVAEKLKRVWQHGEVDAEIAAMQQHGVTPLFPGGDGFPPQLAAVEGCPTLLYVRGALAPGDGEAIGIVGSRYCSSYGRRVAHRMAFDLAKAGFTVVSGLARGIDAEAHRGALEAGGRTIAVLANGLSRVYPPEHAELAEAVAKSGAVVSEACMMAEPLPGMFPNRNRIISGLSRAIVVIEAPTKSGSLITARHAAEQGREVYAVPGNVDSVASAGSLELLRKGARIVRGAADILEDLRGIAPLIEEPSQPKKPKLDAAGAKLWELLAEPLTIDELSRMADVPVSQLAGQLMTFELQGIIRKMPGNVYERVS